MVDTRKQGRSVQVPLFLAIFVPLLALLLGLYALALAFDRNPLPFPDRDYQVFSASSAEALVAMEDVMQSLGQRPRFRADSPDVQRTIFASGTIINQPDPRMLEQLGSPIFRSMVEKALNRPVEVRPQGRPRGDSNANVL